MYTAQEAPDHVPQQTLQFHHENFSPSFIEHLYKLYLKKTLMLELWTSSKT